MTTKQLLFREEVRDKIRCGVDALADAVKVTLGPRGRSVVLDRDCGPPQILNSGVLAAKSIELKNRFKNMGAQLLREVASRSSEMAADATTTATVLAHAMIRQSLRYLAMARPCKTSQEIARAASISANNDRSIVELGLTRSKATPAHPGRARQVEVGKDDTTVIGGAGNSQAIEERIVSIRTEHGAPTSDRDREQLGKRMSKLSGGVALIKVDAATRTPGDLLQWGVMDPVMVTRLALQNAGSIASPVWKTDGMITNAPAAKTRSAPGLTGADLSEF